MTAATLIMPYYDNPTMLREHYKLIRSFPASIRELLSVVIVDDGSPDAPAFAEDLDGVALTIYRVTNDIRWFQHGARNIGVHHCPTKLMLLTDIDHLCPKETWEFLLLKPRKDDPNRIFVFPRVSAPDLSPYKPHPNSYFMSTEVFNRAGGYDERFKGYYGTDSDLRHRLERINGFTECPKPLIRVPREVVPDASTTRYVRKAPEDQGIIKRIRQERAALPGWRPLRLTEPYTQVFP